MAEVETTTTTTDDQPQHTASVSYERFKAINDKLTEERRKASELEARMQQLEDRDKTDVERLTKDLERAQKEREQSAKELEGERAARVKSEKASWLQAAAAKANFHDADAATLYANLDEIENAKDAEKAVQRIAKDKTYLVKDDVKQAPLQRVGIAGAETDASGATISEDEVKRQWGAQMLEAIDQRTGRAASGE